MRFLLRPGWIALTLAVAGFAFGCYYLLAPWQFHRSDERAGNNAALTRAVATAPVPRGSLVPRGTEPDDEAAWRQVVVTGTYQPGEVLARLRSVDGAAASEVLTPLRTTDGETLLVDRGYVRPAGTVLPTIPPAPGGVVTVVAYQRPDETPSDREPIDQAGFRQFYAIDTAQIGAVTGTAFSPGYLQLLPDQPGVVTAVPLPQPDPNPSYSYAWQWLIFGLMAIGGWAYLVRLEYRTRREESGTPDEPANPDTPAAPRTTAEVLADRYGR